MHPDELSPYALAVLVLVLVAVIVRQSYAARQYARARDPRVTRFCRL
jgi:hypothetical protein